MKVVSINTNDTNESEHRASLCLYMRRQGSTDANTALGPGISRIVFFFFSKGRV